MCSPSLLVTMTTKSARPVLKAPSIDSAHTHPSCSGMYTRNTFWACLCCLWLLAATSCHAGKGASGREAAKAGDGNDDRYFSLLGKGKKTLKSRKSSDSRAPKEAETTKATTKETRVATKGETEASGMVAAAAYGRHHRHGIPHRHGRRHRHHGRHRHHDRHHHHKGGPLPVSSCSGCTGSERTAVLTYDDGPTKWTNELLNVLKRHGVTATFFVLGSNINSAERKRTIKRMYDEGHTVANHSFSHAHFTHLTPEQMEREINSTSDIVQKIIRTCAHVPVPR